MPGSKGVRVGKIVPSQCAQCFRSSDGSLALPGSSQGSLPRKVRFKGSSSRKVAPRRGHSKSERWEFFYREAQVPVAAVAPNSWLRPKVPRSHPDFSVPAPGSGRDNTFPSLHLALELWSRLRLTSAQTNSLSLGNESLMNFCSH